MSGSDAIETEHLLLRLLKQPDPLLAHMLGTANMSAERLRLERGLAWEILSESRVALTPVREALVMHASGTAPPPPEIAWTFPRQHCSLARSGDVYFMTAVDGPHPGRRTASEDTAYGAFASTSSVGFSTLTEDMAGLRGPFDIELHGEYHNLDALFAALRDQLGTCAHQIPGVSPFESAADTLKRASNA